MLDFARETPPVEAPPAVIKTELDSWLYGELEGVVQSGPFAGMRLLDKTVWQESRLAPMLLGCYEEELHGELETQIKRLSTLERPKVGVIGCAEGYYAVGLGRRLPNARVFGVDLDERATAICREAALLNSVGLVTNPAIEQVMVDPDFLFLDCEGAEDSYLDLERFPNLRETHMVIEVHAYPDHRTDLILFERFRSSHHIQLVPEAGRNPNQYRWLQPLTSDYRWLAVSENRPCLMGWFILTPRGKVVR